MNNNLENANYSLITGDKNLKYLLGYDEEFGGIQIRCKAKEGSDDNNKFCQSSCGYNLMIEGYSGTGKTILASQLCCKTISNGKDPSSFAMFYSLDQSSREIEKMITSFNFLKSDQIHILDENESLQTWFAHNPNNDNKKLFIRELRNIQNLNQLLGKLQDDFSPEEEDDDKNEKMKVKNGEQKEVKKEEKCPKCPLIIVIDSINTIIRRSESYRGELKEILDFPWWKKNCCSEFKPISKILTFEKGRDNDRIEEYLCDCVIELQKESQNRRLDIVKIRNQPSSLGGNVFDIIPCTDKSEKEIKPSGIFIYPTLESCNKIYYNPNEQIILRNLGKKIKEQKGRAGFGINELDNEFGSDNDGNKKFGINYGSSILIKGDPGCYKTELAMKFLLDGYFDRIIQYKLDNSSEEKPYKFDKCIFISFRMSSEGLLTVKLAPDDKRKKLLNNEENDFIFIRGFDTPFQTASHFMYKIREQIDTLEKRNNGEIVEAVTKAVFFGIDVLNCYPTFKPELLEFFQVLLDYFKKKHISCVFVEWSTSESESELTKLARHLIPNQIEIKNMEGYRFVKFLRKEHRFSTKYVPGRLKLNDEKTDIVFCTLKEVEDIRVINKLAILPEGGLFDKDLLELFNIDESKKNIFLKLIKKINLRNEDIVKIKNL